MANDVSRYYDFIYLWTQLTNRFGAFREVAPHTIHRPLTNPKSGEFKTETIHELIADEVRSLGAYEGLDAGCGYGGTAMELYRQLGGHWHGITVNRHQIRIAEKNAQAMGIEDNVTFALRSYDAPLTKTFNVIYGIESLVHSTAPERTIANLAASLVTNGTFLVVDDMPIENVPEAFRADVETFKRCWRCPILPTAAEWTAHLRSAGLRVQSNRDLTALTGPREEAEIQNALRELGQRQKLRKFLGLGLVSDAELGGLMLERLLREHIIQYRMIVARKI